MQEEFGRAKGGQDAEGESRNVFIARLRASWSSSARWEGRHRSILAQPPSNIRGLFSGYSSRMSPEPVSRLSSTPPDPTLPWMRLRFIVPCTAPGRFTVTLPDELRASRSNPACDGTCRVMLPDPVWISHAAV